MTTSRRDGEGSPIGAWFRSNPRLDSISQSLVNTDIDWAWHRYRTNIDGLGTRDVRLMMEIETKSFGRSPDDSQRETQFIRHQLMARKKSVQGIHGEKMTTWHFGQFYLRMAGEVPKDDELMDWGTFDTDGEIKWRRVRSVGLLEEILRFERRPDDPNKKLSLRRHHKTAEIYVQETLPLGFESTRIVLKRS